MVSPRTIETRSLAMAVTTLAADIGDDLRFGASRLDDNDFGGKPVLAQSGVRGGRPGRSRCGRDAAQRDTQRQGLARCVLEGEPVLAAHQLAAQQVHGRRADEATDECVGRLVVELERGADLLDDRRRA